MIDENETQKNTEKYNNINDVIQDLIINKNKTEDKGKDKEYYNNIINKVESIFTSGKYDTSKLDSGKDEIITAEKITITLTTSKNQKNNTNNNMTIIDLGECENILRNSNKISDDEPLYIKKTDVIQDGFNIPKIEYEVYCKFKGNKLSKLNLSICDNTTIYLSIPIALSGNKDKFNSSSDYYKNKCYSSTSDSGTDMIIKDRQKEFVDNGLTVCQEECFFKDYNSSLQIANCSCQVKEATNSYDNMNINKTKLSENFEIKNDKMGGSNLGITSCDVFSSNENIKSNTGFFLLLLILAIFIIIFIIFCTKGYII